MYPVRLLVVAIAWSWACPTPAEAVASLNVRKSVPKVAALPAQTVNQASNNRHNHCPLDPV